MAVPTAETTREPRQPRREEKNPNIQVLVWVEVAVGRNVVMGRECCV